MPHNSQQSLPGTWFPGATNDLTLVVETPYTTIYPSAPKSCWPTLKTPAPSIANFLIWLLYHPIHLFLFEYFYNIVTLTCTPNNSRFCFCNDLYIPVVVPYPIVSSFVASSPQKSISVPTVLDNSLPPTSTPPPPR